MSNERHDDVMTVAIPKYLRCELFQRSHFPVLVWVSLEWKFALRSMPKMKTKKFCT